MGGLGWRRAVAAHALRLVTVFFLGLRPTTPRHRRSAIGCKKNRALRGSAAHLPTSLVCLKSRILRSLLRGDGKEASHSAGILGKSALGGWLRGVGDYWARRAAR